MTCIRAARSGPVRLVARFDQNEGMDRSPHARLVRLATVGDVNTARVLVARLAAEGIEARIHGDSLGPYPVTVGALAETQIWVPSDRVDEARLLLLDAEINDVLSPIEREEPVKSRRLSLRLAALAVGAAIVVLFALRLASVY